MTQYSPLNSDSENSQITPNRIPSGIVIILCVLWILSIAFSICTIGLILFLVISIPSNTTTMLLAESCGGQNPPRGLCLVESMVYYVAQITLWICILIFVLLAKIIISAALFDSIFIRTGLCGRICKCFCSRTNRST